MSTPYTKLAIPATLIGLFCATPAAANPFFFSTGDPDGKMATASRPGVGTFEIESADDFVLTASSTIINSAEFTGLLTLRATTPDVGQVVVEIYRVFPFDSDVGRTSGPPTFSTPEVPTRFNSPSDKALDSRDSAVPSSLTFSTVDLGSGFTALNSVQPGGIHPKPNQTTTGNGPITGDEVRFDVNFTTPFSLPAGHYFFVPQVDVTGGDFLWLSAPKPITGGTGPFTPDLQSWTRDGSPGGIDPDWLRVGTDIVGGTPAPTFNAVFSLTGSAVPEPATWAMMLLGFAGLGFAGYRRARASHAMLAA